MASQERSNNPAFPQQSEHLIERVALYARVSTANGQQDPEMQLRDLREYVSRHGWLISDEYVDNGVSGAKWIGPEARDQCAGLMIRVMIASAARVNTSHGINGATQSPRFGFALSRFVRLCV
jgi:hypothetical protein